jgi:flagellar L-ring protein precursor FlgH
MKNLNTMLYVFWVMSVLVFSGCAAKQEAQPQAETRAIPVETSNTGPEASQSQANRSGSLWQNNTGSLFTAKKATQVGDILTVAIYEQASAEKEAATSTDRSSSASLGVPNLFGLETSLINKNPNVDPSKLLSASSSNEFQGAGSTTREEKLSATLTTQVVEVLASGNLRIQGSKTVRVNHEDQVIRLSGIVRSEDITASNMIDSKYVLDAKIEYLGKGVLTDKQKPGWGIRLMDTIWPF